MQEELKIEQEKSNKYHMILKSFYIDTPIGSMLAIADEKFLYFLEFADQQSLEHEIKKLYISLNADIISGNTKIIQQINSELQAYFQGTLKEFKTPFYLVGTPFQKLVWQELMRIPYGTTRSYNDQSIAIGKETANRAVANANGANLLSIIIPCHRIIRSDGRLGGYGGGIDRKKWLITHEQQHI